MSEKEIQIRAQVYFVTTNGGGLYKGSPVYSISEVLELNLDFIIVTSFKYGQEIKESLSKIGFKENVWIQENHDIINFCKIFLLNNLSY